jgi:hypothetical protein
MSGRRSPTADGEERDRDHVAERQRPTTSVTAKQRKAMCSHQPPCPPADHRDRDAARTVAFHPEQGWSLLCNGVIVFDDMGEILPGGRGMPPHCPARVRLPVAA